MDFRTGYFDFGSAVQTAWLVSQGQFNALAMGRPISILTGAIYAIYPHPETLLAIQSYDIAMGALPVFLLGKKQLGNEWYALSFSVLYLIFPPVWGVNQYEYHDLAFCITFLLFSTYFYVDRNMIGYTLSILLALSSNPFVLVIAAFVAISIVMDYFQGAKSRTTLNFLVVTVVAVVAFTAYLELIPYLPYYKLSSLGAQSYTLTGSTSYVNPIVPIMQPVYSVTYALPAKLLYLASIFGSVLFLPVLSKTRLLPGLPWVGVVVFYTPKLGAGGVGPVYELSQWSSFILPFVFVGAIFGFSKVRHRSNHFGRNLPMRRMGMTAMILTTLAFATVAGGLSPLSPPQPLSVGDSTIPTDVVPGSLFHGIFPTPVRDSALLNGFLEQVPLNYSVLTQNQIGSKLGHRASPVWTFYQPGYGNVSADAILIDTNLPGLCSTCLNQILSSGRYYQYVAYDDGGIALYFKLQDVTNAQAHRNQPSLIS